MSQTPTLESQGSARPFPRLRVEHGISLAHRRLSSRQRQVIAADVADGMVIFQPTVRELSRIFHVSARSIARMQRLTPEQRQLVLKNGH
jgi:hypothetical protein